MKTIGKGLFVFVIIIIFSSCFSPWDGDTGTFSISIGGSGGGRAVLPDGVKIEDLEHVITLEGPGPKQTVSVTGAQTVQFSVVPGVWNISIEAYEVNWDGDEEFRFLVAVGSKIVDIKPGSNGAITIPMSKPPENTTIEMVEVKGGSFEMGSINSLDNNASPLRTVTLTSFYIGKYEVTQEQYEAVMGTNPSYHKTDADEGEVQEKRPVENVTWYDAIEFCNKLSSLEGLTPVYTITNRTPASGYPITSATVTATWSNNGYRLPTEAQWEYAAKGGQSAHNPLWIYSGSDDADTVAWYNGKTGTPTNGKTHEVGKLAPNELGLYDMSGNVWEWCWDWYGTYPSDPQTDPTGADSGTLRVQRGGGYDNNTTSTDGNIRSAYRKGYGALHINLGFRVVRPAQSSVEPGTGELHYELIDDGTAYRVSRGTATGDIVIPAYYRPDSNSPSLPVTTIGYGTDGDDSNAFGGTGGIGNPDTYNTTVTRITFEKDSQLTTISSYAFYRCSSLISIDIPDSVTSIGRCAFQETALTSITIPAGVTFISNGTFYECTQLGSIIIPERITEIDTAAFWGCTSLTSVTFRGEGIKFNETSFPPDYDWNLYEVYHGANGGKGTYTRPNGESNAWIKSTDGPPENTYTVTFNTNGGDPKPEPKTVIEGGKVTEPQAVTKLDYFFAGWYKEANFINIWDFETDLVTDNITLYAKWVSPPTNWTAVSNSQFSSIIRAIAYGNNRWVAVGNEGQMAWSANGETWTAVDDNTIWQYQDFANEMHTASISGIAYGDGKFIAVGACGIMAMSTSGDTWNAIEEKPFGTEIDGNSTINAIVYGNGGWVAGGNSGKMAYSNDGVTWEAMNIYSTFGSSQINGIAYDGGSKWVAVGSSGRMAYSNNNGETWTAVDDSNRVFGTEGGIENIIFAVAYGNGRFVAGSWGGQIAYSDDGASWTAVLDSKFGTGWINAIAYGNNMWVAVGAGGRMAYSADGETWTSVEANTFGSDFIQAIVYDNNTWFAGGGSDSSDSSGRMAYSNQ
jgi:uncharacterized repeat protein (TIGR02543 family)